MRLVHVVDRVTAIGGVQTYLQLLLPALAIHGVENAIVAGEGGVELSAQTPVTIAPGVLVDGAELRSGEQTQLREALESLSPDAVYVHTALSPAVVRCVAEVAPPLVYAHDYFMTCPGNARYLQRSRAFCEEGFGLRCFPRAYTERTTNRRPDRLLSAYRRVRAWQSVLPDLPRILVASEFVSEMLVAAGADPAAVKVVPYPVPAAPHAVATSQTSDVVSVGRLVSSKGHDVLLDALARLEDATAVIAGDGPDRGRLEARATRLGLGGRVRFAGWISPAERAGLFAGARTLALPSLWQEPFGIVGLEALASGVPVVASSVGGIPSWLRDGEAGLLVPAGDPGALAAALGRLLGDEDLRRSLAACGPDVAGRFSIERHLELLLPEFEAAVR